MPKIKEDMQYHTLCKTSIRRFHCIEPGLWIKTQWILKVLTLLAGQEGLAAHWKSATRLPVVKCRIALLLFDPATLSPMLECMTWLLLPAKCRVRSGAFTAAATSAGLSTSAAAARFCSAQPAAEDAGCAGPSPSETCTACHTLKILC